MASPGDASRPTKESSNANSAAPVQRVRLALSQGMGGSRDQTIVAGSYEAMTSGTNGQSPLQAKGNPRTITTEFATTACLTTAGAAGDGGMGRQAAVSDE